MVNDNGQLYTIEGLAAGLVMIATAYIVLGSTVVYTPGDTHIADMQLETLGNDALRMMDTPQTWNGSGNLTQIIEMSGKNQNSTFGTVFLQYCNERTVSSADNLQFSAIVTYRNESGGLGQYTLDRSSIVTGREHAVRVTKWVKVDKNEHWDRSQIVLVEVLLWRA